MHALFKSASFLLIIISISLCQSRNWTSKKISTENHDVAVRNVWTFLDKNEENEENVISSKEEEEATSLRTKQFNIIIKNEIDVIPEDDADNDFASEEVCNLQKNHNLFYNFSKKQKYHLDF